MRARPDLRQTSVSRSPVQKARIGGSSPRKPDWTSIFTQLQSPKIRPDNRDAANSELSAKLCSLLTAPKVLQFWQDLAGPLRLGPSLADSTSLGRSHPPFNDGSAAIKAPRGVWWLRISPLHN
ncbi:hypothetical protein TIFTF001_019334 [Ficus carica]|uniref:Uncharacterized protein n=1 Tax=Ficus carica TaxID=3494 RepID=A0AA88DA27_FICCA|nr:hypothetical protein TIFTF001_019334 [Ficus carica]